MKQINIQYKQHFAEYANPMIIRSVFSTIMYTADRLIAALFIGAGALVATTLVSPLMFLIAAFSSLFISGMGAYVGLLIGRDKTEKANHISSGILILMGVLGLVMAIPSILFSEEVAYFLGARNDFFQLAESYLKIFALSFPLLLVGKGMDVLILNDGSPRYSFILNIVVTVTNLLLNLIAVAVLGWGIEGLAWATVISSAFELLGGIYYFLFRSRTLHLRLPRFKIRIILRILYNGLSDFTMMLVEAVMVFVINMAFIQYLTPGHFEAYAAVSIVITLFYSIHMGATMGLQPILSQMMGRKEYSDLKKILTYSVKKTMLYSAVAYIALLPLISRILTLFIEDPATIQIGTFFYITIGIATMFSNYPLQASMFYTAINRPMESAAISTARTLLLIPALTFMAIKFTQAPGVALGSIIADIFLIIGLFLFMNKQDLSKVKVYE